MNHPHHSRLSKNTDSVCHPYWLLRVKDSNNDERLIQSKEQITDYYVNTSKQGANDYIRALQAALADSPPPRDIMSQYDFAQMQATISKITDSVNLVNAQTDLTNKQQVAKGFAKTDRSLAKKDADKAVSEAKEALRQAKKDETGYKFYHVVDYFDRIWRKWSAIGYKYCPKDGIQPAELIKHLRIQFQCRYFPFCTFFNDGEADISHRRETSRV